MSALSPDALDGKTLTLLLCGETDEGEKDWAVFPGVVRDEAGRLSLQRAKGEPPFEIRAEWVARIRPVPQEVREILGGSDHYLQLAVGSLDRDSRDDVVPTGLRWPEANDEAV